MFHTLALYRPYSREMLGVDVNLSRLLYSNKYLLVVGTFLALLFSFLAGRIVARTTYTQFVSKLVTAVLVMLVLLILRQPHWGLVIVASSLPVLEILPPVPYATSVVALLGGVTLASYFLHDLGHHTALSGRLPPGLLWGGLFVIWILVSNPAAALLPGYHDRIWLSTFVQLWLLAWLASRLLDTPAKHRLLMWAFSLAALPSAAYAIHQGVVGQSIKESIRSGGLAGGANGAARYFVTSLVLMYYLWTTTRNRLLHSGLVIGMAVVVYGAVVTVSRTGLLLLILAMGLLSIQHLKQRRWQAIVVLVAVTSVIWIFADNILLILGSILPAVRHGTDTVGIRYALWHAGLRMWLAHPLRGIGIGQFFAQLPFYGADLLAPRYLHDGAHNMYLQVLAETGLIGLVFFIAMLVASGRSLRRFSHLSNAVISPLMQTWSLVFILLLVGGITKHDQYNKLLWLLIGLGGSLSGCSWTSREGDR